MGLIGLKSCIAETKISCEAMYIHTLELLVKIQSLFTETELEMVHRVSKSTRWV